jgi:hypothetical protein
MTQFLFSEVFNLYILVLLGCVHAAVAFLLFSGKMETLTEFFNDWVDNLNKAKTRVVHMRHELHEICIDRRTIWGNPFIIGQDGSREEVIMKYKEFYFSNPILQSKIHELKGKVLGCWCKPKACHGDFLCEQAEAA